MSDESMSPALRATNQRGLRFPALKRWANFNRPLRGRSAKAVGVPHDSKTFFSIQSETSRIARIRADPFRLSRMPISDEALQMEKNRFLAMKSEATVGQACAALNALGGQPWWHLVVRMDDGSWAVARFSELTVAGTTSEAVETQLIALEQLRVAAAVERDSIETKMAQTLARKSPARVLVVTANGVPVGILCEGIRRSAAPSGGLTSANLDQLGGKYVKLKDYGSLLLGSSKK